MAEENQLLVGGRNGLAYGTVNQSSSSLQDSQQTTLPNVQIQGENNKIKVSLIILLSFLQYLLQQLLAQLFIIELHLL